MPASTALETAHATIASYNEWKLDSIMAFRAPDCIHYILPASLDRKPLNNEEYAAYFADIMPTFRGFHVTVHDVVHDEAAHKVSMHATSEAETDIGEYRNEYILIFHMTEDGRKVEKVYEYVDSDCSKKFWLRLREYTSKQMKALD